MKLMLVSDFTQIKRSLASTMLVCIFIVVVMTISMGTPIVGAAAVAAMLPYIVVYSVLANDEATGWAKLRDTLPLSRRDIVFGRYAGTLIVVIISCIIAIALSLATAAVSGALGMGGDSLGAFNEGGVVKATALTSLIGVAISLIMLALILPLVMRLGLTRTARVLPIVFVLIVCAFFGFMSDSLPAMIPEASLPLIGAGFAIGALVLFAASALVTCKLYEAREF